MAEHEAEPRTNAKASAFATALQNREVLLLDFGMSRAFRKGETVALIHPFAAQNFAKEERMSKNLPLKGKILLIQNRLRGAVGFRRMREFRRLRTAT